MNPELNPISTPSEDLDLKAREFIPLTLTAFTVLLSLSDGETKHAYAICKDINNWGPSISADTNTVYRSVHMLHDQGLIFSRKNPDYKRSISGVSARDFYVLSELGERVKDLELNRLRSLIEIADFKNKTKSNSTH